MTYKVREGIVRTKICNSFFLVPTRAASEDCPYVIRLNLLSSIVWETFEKHMPEENAIKAFRILTKKNDEEVMERYQKIINSFLEKGFLVEEDQL